MLYFLFTTTKCNLKCAYCEDFPHKQMPAKVEYSLSDLQQFIAGDPDPVFVFYGGEPLINIPYIKEVMDTFDADFVLQSNVTLLDRLPDEYLQRLKSILVSIDGRPETYDQYRGAGMYAKVMRQCQNARERGYQNDLVARMTVSSRSDVYAEVHHLLYDSPVRFDHVYWQLDAGFDGEMSMRWDSFENWLDNSYKPGLTRLTDEWLADMQTESTARGIVPFLGIMHSLNAGTPEHLPIRCGIGHNAFAVATDGKLMGCPVATGDDWNQLGHLHHDSCQDLTGRLEPKGPCETCDIRHICGGRCLIATHNNYWGTNGFDLVCASIRHLVHEMERIQPAVQELVQTHTRIADAFQYPATRWSLEVIP
ncbi:MAG: TIGR04084 family radical SAM/SPASM domain-containing protein [Leptospiraceae bacterium]|nr:TIGR04084 family radical SAM/SPASM domain-containing protein [Leptospiraceae bacterium]